MREAMRPPPPRRRFPNTFPQDQCLDPNLVALRGLALPQEWSGRWESNPRLKLGKLGYYHYTTPAQVGFYAPRRGQRKSFGRGAGSPVASISTSKSSRQTSACRYTIGVDGRSDLDRIPSIAPRSDGRGT